MINITQIEGEMDSMKRLECVEASVRGVVVVNECSGSDVIAIHEWTSFDPGKGNAERVLRQLRTRFDDIGAIGIGEDDSEPAWTFWMYMHSKALVDFLEDDEGNDVTPPLGQAERRRA